MRSQRLRIALAMLVVVTAVTPAGAKRNDPKIHLAYRPQQTVAGVDALLAPEMHRLAVEIRVANRREESARPRIGVRTDDDDRRFDLVATNSVSDYLRGALTQAGSEWGLQVESGAARVLEIEPVKLLVQETNQAVGATYNAQVQLGATLTTSTGSQLWRGSGAGDASRYGKKFSQDNINEVLSDAVLEAFGEILNDRRLHTAWESGSASSMSSPAPQSMAGDDGQSSAPVQPAALLQEVRELLARDVTAETLVAFLRRRTLSAPFDSDDLIAWKEAGVPETVLQVALELPVR